MIAILIIIPTITIIIQLISHKYTYKITKKYWFNLILSVFFLSYFLIFRYIPDFLNLIEQNMNELINISEYEYSFYYSKVLLLDMCPLLAFLIPLSLIIDKTKNFSKCLAPIGLIGSLITLYGGVLFDTDLKFLEWKDFYKYFFLGIQNDSTINRIYFMMHYMLMIISIQTLLNCNQYTKWSLISSAIFYLFFITYALVVSRVLKIQNNVTGLVENDWILPNGQYHVMYNLLPMSFPGIVIFWYFVVIMSFLLIAYIKNYLTNDLFKITKLNHQWYELKVFKKFYPICHKIDENQYNFTKSLKKYIKK